MGKVGEPAPVSGIQAAPQRLDPGHVIGSQRAHHYDPAITQRLLRTRLVGSRHGRSP